MFWITFTSLFFRHHVYEVQTANTFPLGPTENIAEAPRLQHVVWAPINPPPPPGQGPSTTTMTPLPSGSIILNSLAGAAAGGAGKPTPMTGSTASGTANGSGQSGNGVGNGASKSAYSLNQAIAFVHHNDIYYKPKVQGELVCRITQTGAAGIFYNGVPDWTYENVPELESRQSSIVFSPDSHFLAFLSFNDSEVNEYK